MKDTAKYIEQYERVKRWYHRFEEINNGRINDRSSDYYYDDILAFFQNCHHLRDWIYNDETVPKPIRDTVYNYVNDNDCLRYCADIANGAKHLKLINDRRKISQDIVKGPRNLYFNILKTGEIVREEYFFLVGDCKISAFELATDCLKKWDDFLHRI